MSTSSDMSPLHGDESPSHAAWKRARVEVIDGIWFDDDGSPVIDRSDDVPYVFSEPPLTRPTCLLMARKYLLGLYTLVAVDDVVEDDLGITIDDTETALNEPSLCPHGRTLSSLCPVCCGGDESGPMTAATVLDDDSYAGHLTATYGHAATGSAVVKDEPMSDNDLPDIHLGSITIQVAREVSGGGRKRNAATVEDEMLAALEEHDAEAAAIAADLGAVDEGLTEEEKEEEEGEESEEEGDVDDILKELDGSDKDELSSAELEGSGEELSSHPSDSPRGRTAKRDARASHIAPAPIQEDVHLTEVATDAGQEDVPTEAQGQEDVPSDSGQEDVPMTTEEAISICL